MDKYGALGYSESIIFMFCPLCALLSLKNPENDDECERKDAMELTSL